MTPSLLASVSTNVSTILLTSSLTQCLQYNSLCEVLEPVRIAFLWINSGSIVAGSLEL